MNRKILSILLIFLRSFLSSLFAFLSKILPLALIFFLEYFKGNGEIRTVAIRERITRKSDYRKAFDLLLNRLDSLVASCNRCTYSMPKKSCPIILIGSIYKIGQNSLNIKDPDSAVGTKIMIHIPILRLFKFFFE